MQQRNTQLERLFSALDRRARRKAMGDLERADQAAQEASIAIEAIGRSARPTVHPIDTVPPRSVAVAMAQALFGLPHLTHTLAASLPRMRVVAAGSSDELATVLGLPRWELDEIREDVDRRAAFAFKQARAMAWLWSRFRPEDDPEPLFRTLFPTSRGGIREFRRSGFRLYAVVDQADPAPPASLYLSWLPGTSNWTCTPGVSFQGKFVDDSLRRRLARGIGLDLDEVDILLDSFVEAVPSASLADWIAHDRWRSEGWAAMSGLGLAHAGPGWLVERLASETIDPDGWLTQTETGISISGARRQFDRLAMARVQVLGRSLYAEMFARFLDDGVRSADERATLYDLAPYIQRVLRPVLDWTASAGALSHLAEQLGISAVSLKPATRHVHELWLRSAQGSWGGAPSAEHPETVQTILATHLAVLETSLKDTLETTVDPRGDHRGAALLFAACYLARAPLGRLWKSVDGAMPEVEDVVGRWFQPLWRKILELDEEGVFDPPDRGMVA